MILTSNQAREILEAPPHKEELASCMLHESALRVFTEDLDEHELRDELYWHKLLKIIEKRVTSNKAARILDFIRYPIPVVQLTDSIIGEFLRVFDGKNKFFKTQGDRDLTRLTDWIETKNLEKWIQTNAKEVFKNKPCSFVVVDRDVNGEPICIFLDSSRIIDVEEKSTKTGRLEYIAFIHSVTEDENEEMITRVAVYDDENYHIFIKDNDNLIFDETLSAKHNIGHTPGVFFIQETNNSKNIYKRRSAFGSSISKLEDWTIFDIFRNYQDHYAPFPVTESVVSKCGNPHCEDGAVKNTEVLLEGPKKGQKRTIYAKCHVCDGEGKGKAYIGPGTHIGIKHQASKQFEDASGKFRMIFPETDKLKYIPEKLHDLELEIRFKTVGVNNMLTTQAVNLDQVKGSFMAMESVLMRNKTILDQLYVFIVETAGKMFFTNLDIKIEADHGTEWYLITEEDLQKRFDEAKKIGLPINEVLSIYRQIVETKYSNNPSKRDREIMLIDIQEFPFYSLDECIKLKNIGTLDAFQLSLKTNFYNFVNRFERENGIITMFGLSVDLSKRIEIIKETLEGYNNEILEIQKTRISEEPINIVEPIIN